MDLTRPHRILLLDDEAEIVEQCAIALKKQYLVVKTNSCFEALAFMDAGRDMIDLVICDFNMPGMNGAEFVDRIRKQNIQTPVVLCTGMEPDSLGLSLAKFVKVVQKPFGVSELRAAVVSSLAQNDRMNEQYKKMRGASIPMRLSMAELQKYLAQRGMIDPSEVDPNTVLKRFGHGDEFHIYMAWHYLHSFYARIQAEERAE